LSNIKKLRKIRVVPLGLEMAAQLVEDCWQRKEYFIENGKKEPSNWYDDITTFDPDGLGICVFKPYSRDLEELGVTLDEIRNFNKDIMMNKVINVTLAEVIGKPGQIDTGFYGWGGGVCGDQDFVIDNGKMTSLESPFCNLVDPDWKLKVPAIKCDERDKMYIDRLTSPASADRMEFCSNMQTCLIGEDERSGCSSEIYGHCVKEKNSWEFEGESCYPYHSCEAFSNTRGEIQGYLKDTLINAGCNQDNSGCWW